MCTLFLLFDLSLSNYMFFSVLGAACFAITLLPEVEAAEKRRKLERLRHLKENKD